MKFQLTRMDEWPRHQLGVTFDSVGTPSPHWSDGYYFTLGDAAGACTLYTALRLYPNTDVLDGYALVGLREGQQYNMRFSRRLRPNIDDLCVGPLWMEIVEGLKTIKFGARDNPHGITFDLLWEGFSPPHFEDYITRYANGRLVTERSNYVQVGNVSGAITAGGRTFAVENWAGVRDHSWGIGDTGGEPSPAAAPISSTARPFGLRQWTVIRFPGRAVYYQFHQNPDGRTTMFESHVQPPYGGAGDAWSYRGLRVESIEFVDGQRRLKRAELAFRRPDGGEDRFGMEPLSTAVYMQGGGYWGGWKDGRGRGVYRGDAYDEGEVWDVSRPTTIGEPDGSLRPAPREGWAETYARFWNLDDPSETGMGHLECVIGGPYPGITA